MTTDSLHIIKLKKQKKVVPLKILAYDFNINTKRINCDPTVNVQTVKLSVYKDEIAKKKSIENRILELKKIYVNDSKTKHILIIIEDEIDLNCYGFFLYTLDLNVLKIIDISCDGSLIFQQQKYMKTVLNDNIISKISNLIAMFENIIIIESDSIIKTLKIILSGYSLFGHISSNDMSYMNNIYSKISTFK